MLLVDYRSVITTLIQLFLTAIALQCSRGVIAVLAQHDRFGLTTFAGNILTMLAIAAATDYGIFLFGRYKEARASGEDRNSAYYSTFRSVAPVIHDGRTGRDRDGRHRGIGRHARAGGALPGQPGGSVRVEACGSQQVLLLGSALRRHPPVARRCARSSSRSTASMRSPINSRHFRAIPTGPMS